MVTLLVRVCVSMSLVGGVHSSVAVSTNPSHFAPDPEGQVWSSATVSSGHKRVDFTSATNTSPRLHAKHCTEMLLPSQVRVGESVSNFCVSASPCVNPCAITFADAFFLPASVVAPLNKNRRTSFTRSRTFLFDCLPCCLQPRHHRNADNKCRGEAQ